MKANRPSTALNSPANVLINFDELTTNCHIFSINRNLNYMPSARVYRFGILAYS
jgi:hypothetical protein